MHIYKVVRAPIRSPPSFASAAGCNEGQALRFLHASGRALRLVQTWEIAQLGSFHLGKYPRKGVIWINAYGKVFNIILSSMGKRKKMSKLNMTGGSPVAELSRSISAPTDRLSRGISRLVWLVYKLAGVPGVTRGS